LKSKLFAADARGSYRSRDRLTDGLPSALRQNYCQFENHAFTNRGLPFIFSGQNSTPIVLFVFL
jgi:hypothetical protein